MSKDYYQILGIDKKASKDDIKKAFRKLAHKYHPDKAGGDEQKFKEINEAYQILSNDQKRREYDMYGNVFSGGQGQQGSGFGGFSNFDFGDQFEFDLGDIFSDFFGGQTFNIKKKRGRDISVDIQVSFAEAIFGVERKLLINKVVFCPDCGGSGAKKGTSLKKCFSCDGQGRLRENRRSFFGTISTWRECTNCAGRGEIPEEKCSNCNGLGVLKKSEEIKIFIPSGIEDGEMIRMSGKGEATPGGVSGDLYIKIHVEKDSTFKRVANDLLMDLNVKLTDAILGSEYEIKTLDGKLKIKIPAGINFGEILKVKGKGVPYGANRRGDLLVKVIINIPQKLSRKAKKKIEELREEGM
ncbi:MAG TPA: molecular chaperone DnaJ [Candidatus Vogelbacteria bacterium]|nr:molecular chaperone DnaJ [Candidatus Vogelbacteria bacterium]